MTIEVCFSHGQESGPWGSKIRRMADVCRRKGHGVHSVDYRGVADADRRVDRLVGWCRGRPDDAPPLVLVGSSMGGYVALGAAPLVDPVGVFLLAPAIYLPGYGPLQPGNATGETEIVHGLGDEVVPVEHSLRYAREAGVTLHAIPGGHRLIDALPVVLGLFEAFVDRVSGALSAG